MKSKIILILFIVLANFEVLSQNKGPLKASSVDKAAYVREIPALSKMKNIISAKGMGHVAQEKKRGKNTFVPGKGFPRGEDPLLTAQKNAVKKYKSEPLKSFDAHKGEDLNDPTGAIGPNHYVYAFNSGFGILDRDGNVLLEEASLGTLFPGETLGDPIVIYDQYAERFIIMEFSDSPNGFLIAICKGKDPINDPWFTYRFNTLAFPDYEKISIWGDGYYVTANIFQGEQETQDVIFVLERDKMLKGEVASKVIKFPLAGAKNHRFYSPASFNSTSKDLPPLGTPCSIIYFQDDSWAGVSEDHIKIWDINVDWSNPDNSTISQPLRLKTTPFKSVLNGGDWTNLEQPGGSKIDALQGAMMYMTNYRRFGTHNSVVFNFVVDVNGDDSRSGIRWYELRQDDEKQPWEIYQEGTYLQPDGNNASCGSIAIDSQGNIGLGYTAVGPELYVSLRYTGRLVNDPLGVMTIAEGISATGDSRVSGTRYGDYAQMTIDPLDGDTFWHIGEYMKGENDTRKSHVVAFKLADTTDDIDDVAEEEDTEEEDTEEEDTEEEDTEEEDTEEEDTEEEDAEEEDSEEEDSEEEDSEEEDAAEEDAAEEDAAEEEDTEEEDTEEEDAAEEDDAEEDDAEEDDAEEDDAEEDDAVEEIKCVKNDITITVLFDDYPEEVSWDIVNDDTGEIVAKNAYAASVFGTSAEDVVSGLPRGNYTFTIYDTFQDGICCTYGNGRYIVGSISGLLVEGSNFGASQSTSFCYETSKLETFDLADVDKNNTRFILSPNPVNDLLRISKEKLSIDRITIYSLLGKLVHTIDNKPSKHIFDIKNLSSGTYFARIEAGKEIITRRFVKK